MNGVTGALAAPSDEAPAETPKRGEKSEAMVQQENFQGKLQRCKARIDSDGNFENIEASELWKSRFLGDFSTGATKFGNAKNSHQIIMMIIMMMQMYLIAMQATCRSIEVSTFAEENDLKKTSVNYKARRTIEVSTFAEENDLKKTSVNYKPPQTKLRLKRSITM